MLRKILRLVALLLVVGIIAIQFFRPAKNLAATPSPDDILRLHPAPPAVARTLAVACYDCHSDHTRYPWYAGVQPVGWWLAHHVDEGKRHLDFSRFGRYSAKSALHKLEDCSDLVDSGEMPLASYKITHADARLTADQRKQLIAWFDSVHDRLDPDPAD